MPNLDQELEKAEGKALSRKFIYAFVFVCALFGAAGGFLYWALSDLPRVNAIEEYVPAESSKVYSSDGKILAEFY